jgi:hypothetical protein
MVTGERGTCAPLGPLLMFALWSAFSGPVSAQWEIATQRLDGTQADATVARNRNGAGFAVEFYRDGVGAVRARFSLAPGLTTMPKNHCPTLQVDRWAPVNRSINDAACVASGRWAEYVLGYVAGGRLKSERLLQIMNGTQLTFRFRLDNGEYRDAPFDLAGSKRSLTAAIGANVVVTAR